MAKQLNESLFIIRIIFKQKNKNHKQILAIIYVLVALNQAVDIFLCNELRRAMIRAVAANI